ncbi:MAG TPA: tail fiber protein [Bryobacteraceae bacterium]|nr:tail fiber protein [Bryobacteraceae bacterium]
MAEPFLGEVRIFSFNFAPKGWAQCNGQFLPINQNQALFALFGTTYGGNGQTTFALPDLRDRAPIHVGQGFTQGQKGGEAAHTLTLNEMAQHNHPFVGSGNGATLVAAAGNLPGLNSVDDIYLPTSPSMTALAAGSVTNTGGSQPHNNLQPFITLNFCVALQGIFPSRN